MKCGGLHCEGCSNHGGGGAWGGAALLGLIVLIAIVRRPLERAAHTAAHVAGDVLQVAAWTIGVLAAGAVLAGFTWAGLRARRVVLRRRAAAALAASQASAVTWTVTPVGRLTPQDPPPAALAPPVRPFPELGSAAGRGKSAQVVSLDVLRQARQDRRGGDPR